MADFTSEVVADTKGLERFIAQARPVLEKVVAIAGLNVETEAKRLIVEKDIIDTGATLNTTRSTPIDGGLGASIGPSTHYAPFLEFGTVKMAARPFMRPALEKERQAFQDAIIAALQQVANG